MTVDTIRHWFDETYRSRGRSYLRPPEAYRVLVELLAPRSGASLLDVACGPAHLLHEARDYGLKLSGVDFSRVALDLGRALVPDADLRYADATALPFADGSFDYVTCIGALERMPMLEAVLREQRRVATNDARFCFLVRNANTLTWRFVMEGLRLKNVEGHQGAASIDEWTERFDDAGLSVERVVPDQWPLMWRERIARRLGFDATFERVRPGVLPLRTANELIFVLRKS